jgi:outer membrane protein OmpA-like peptidoglycan-associated protein
MTSNSPFAKFLPLAAVAATAGALVGCTTVQSISPFSSSVPYSQDIQPTIPKPAIAEIPAFKPKPKPEVSVSEKPVPAPAAEAPPAPAPTGAPPAAPSSAPAVSEAPPPAPAAPPPPAAPQSQSSVGPDTATKTAKAGESSEDTEVAGGGEKKPQPTIPEADKAFNDDGTYPNLAQVPARPVNMPTFTEAKALEKALVADAGKAKVEAPASPEAPSVDSSPVPVSKLVKSAAAPAITAAADRPEDSSPCLSGKVSEAKPTATVSFAAGSAAIDTGRLQALVEAMPSIRAATGTIRIFGHGDPGAEGAAGSGRFDLAVARANAVAQAVAGYGIPAPRIAVGVACSDAALGGSSVQLYAES